MCTLINGFVSTYLFPQSSSPSNESLEVSLSKYLKIFAICENFWRCEIEATPSKCGLVMQALRRTQTNVLLLLICFKRNSVYASEEGNRVRSPDKVSSCALFEQRVVSVFVPISSPTFLLGLKDVSLEIVG